MSINHELSEVKELRKKLGLTQGQLAKKADVSQSLIAKIEADRIDPTFTKTKKIFQALIELSKKHLVSIESIMHKKLITVGKEELLQLAVKKMRKYEISQLPVTEDNNVLGLVSESAILNKMAELDDPKKLSELKVKEAMIEAPPIITKSTDINVVVSLLKYYPVVLVSKEGKLIGLISKSDMIGNISKR